MVLDPITLVEFAFYKADAKSNPCLSSGLHLSVIKNRPDRFEYHPSGYYVQVVNEVVVGVMDLGLMFEY